MSARAPLTPPPPNGEWECGSQLSNFTHHNTGTLSLLAFLVHSTAGLVSLSKAHPLPEPQFPLKNGHPESTRLLVPILEQRASSVLSHSNNEKDVSLVDLLYELYMLSS